jgi:hypothetical protein
MSITRVLWETPVLATILIRQLLLWYQIESLQTLHLFRPKAGQRMVHISRMSCPSPAPGNEEQ